MRQTFSSPSDGVVARAARRVGPALAVLMLIAASGTPATRAAGAAILRIDAPRQVPAGAPITLTFTVENAANLGGYEAAVLFDTGAAELAGLDQRASGLRQPGRDTGALSVGELRVGAAFGMYSCPTANCVERAGPRQTAGASGEVRLATLDLLPLAPGPLEIALGAVKFVDTAGQPVQVALPAQPIVVQVGPAGAGPRHPAPPNPWALAAPAFRVAGTLDLDGDGAVGHADLIETAMAWTVGRERSKPCGAEIDPTRDVNHDGCIDIADIQRIAAGYSAPIPAPQAAEPSAALEFVVNSTRDLTDTSIGDRICRTSAGVCTLRAAIQEANRHTGRDRISFAIPGGGVHTIQLNNPLPALSDQSGGTIIDGYTQPGAAPNTDPLVSNAAIKVQVAGRGVDGFDGFAISAAGNVVRGLAIYKVHRPFWLYGAGAHDNVLVGDIIGTDVGATYRTPSFDNAHGVYIVQTASRNQIGRAAPADRNVISGNGRDGVGLWDQGTDGNMIMNNLIGFDPSGTRRVSNILHGVDMNMGPSYTIVGGTGPYQRNVICCTGRQGIEISHESITSYNRVIGNFVGTDVTGAWAPSFAAVQGYGIQVKDRVANNVVSSNVIGNSWLAGIRVDEYGHCCVGRNRFAYNRVGISRNGRPIPNGGAGIWITASYAMIGPGNTIAYNPIGVRIEGPGNDQNTITRNAIFDNRGLGIDLGPIGSVNSNDWGDYDGGPNQQLNFPVLTGATPQYVSGQACAGCRVEIFAASSQSALYGEGQRFVGAGLAGPRGGFNIAISGVPAGAYVTATATSPGGNTSEFSLNRLVKR